MTSSKTYNNNKNDIIIVIVLLLTIATTIHTTSAVSCFSCSPAESNCGVTYSADQNNVMVCTGDWCLKTTVSYNGQLLITRECITTANNNNNTTSELNNYNYTGGCRVVNVLGAPVEICTCKSDYCNGYTNNVNDILAVNSDQSQNSNNKIKCLSCVGQQCNDPVNLTLSTCRGPSCYQNTFTSEGVSITIKGCSSLIQASDSCQTRTYNNVTSVKCLCSEGQYCNRSPVVAASSAVVVATSALIVAFFTNYF